MDRCHADGGPAQDVAPVIVTPQTSRDSIAVMTGPDSPGSYHYGVMDCCSPAGSIEAGPAKRKLKNKR